MLPTPKTNVNKLAQKFEQNLNKSTTELPSTNSISKVTPITSNTINNAETTDATGEKSAVK